MRVSAPLAAVVVVASSVALVAACGSSSDSEFDDGHGSSGGSNGGTSGGFGSSGTSGASGASGSADAGNGECFAPVEMYIMLDKSGSMGEPEGNGSPGDCDVGQNVDSKWCRGINAMSGYLGSPAAKDQSAALQFFSGDKADCDDGSPYDKPATPKTGYRTLPSDAFDDALNDEVPGGNTPMEAALRGLTKFTAANRTAGHVTIGILVTDGDPKGCNQDLDDLAQILDDHYKATTIRTYVIGMEGATFRNLEKIAAGGHAPTHPDTVGALKNACGDVKAPCQFWNVGNGDPQGFIQALAAIQESADGCNAGGGQVNPVK